MTDSFAARIEDHPGRKLSDRAVRLFEKAKINEHETPLASTKGVLSQGDTASRRKMGRKGFLVLTDCNLYWVALRGAYDVQGLSRLRVPQQFLGTQSLVYVFGSVFYTRRFRGVHVRRFIELNNLAAMWSEQSDDLAPAADVPVSQEDVAGQIGKLAQLKDQGHITPEEFELKKAELLDRM